MKLRFHHPLNGTVYAAEVPAETTFDQMTQLLYDAGFLPYKRGGYYFIIDGHVCTRNRTVSAYAAPADGNAVDVKISGMLTILL